MHYLWIIAIVIMFIIILISLLKLFLPKKVLGVFSYRASSWLSELGSPSLLKQHTSLSVVLCQICNKSLRELQFASAPVMIIIIFLIVPLTIWTSQSDDSGVRLEDDFYRAGISF